MDYIALTAAILGSSAVTALAGGLWSYLTKRKRQQIDWDSQAKSTVMKVLDDERKENEKQGAQVEALTKRIEVLILENAELKKQIALLELKLDRAMEMLEALKKESVRPPKAV